MVAYLRENHATPRAAEVDKTPVPDGALTPGVLLRMGSCGGFANTLGAPAPDAEAALQVAGAFGSGDRGPRGFDLLGLDLDYVQANGASLEGASLRESTLRFARLENANLSFARLRSVSAAFSCLRGASLVGARGDLVDFRGANLAGAN